jgi:hypothetical protein
MFTNEAAKRLILDLFEEQALVIGGLVAVHEVDDDLVWRLMKNLDVIAGKAIDRLNDQKSEKNPDPPVSSKPHPAIEEFLLKLRRL